MVLTELRDAISSEVGDEVLGVAVFEPKWREYGGGVGMVLTGFSWWRSREAWFPRNGAVAVTASTISLFAVDLTDEGWVNARHVGTWQRADVTVSQMDEKTTQLIVPDHEPAALTQVFETRSASR